MKKIMSFASVLLFAVMLTACSNQNNDINTNSSTSTMSSDNENSGSETTSNSESQINSESREFSKSATIKETVLVDENNVKITAAELTYGNYDAELSLNIENNSDSDLSFIAASAGYSCNSVNGYMISDGYLNCDVAAGKKANDTISISYDTLKLYGIFEIADIEIGFDISDGDNHTYTGPRTVLTTASENYDYETPVYRQSIAGDESQTEYNYTVPYFSSDAAYEKNGLTIASQAVVKNKSGEYMLFLEVVNTTDAIVGVSTTDIDINGLRVYSSTWSYDFINPGKTAIVDVNLSSVIEPEYLEAYGITEIGKVALKVAFDDTKGNEVAAPAKLSIDIPDADSSFNMSGSEIYNDNGVRVVSKGVYSDSSEYSNDLHILLAAENTSGKALKIDDVYDSLSVNGYMTSYSFYTTTVEDDGCVAIDITLWESDLEDINISGPSDVKNIEFSVSIKDENNKEIDEANIKFTTD